MFEDPLNDGNDLIPYDKVDRKFGVGPGTPLRKKPKPQPINLVSSDLKRSDGQSSDGDLGSLRRSTTIRDPKAPIDKYIDKYWKNNIEKELPNGKI